MLITLCYALLTLVQQRQRTRLLRVLREHVRKGSILFHRQESLGNATVSSDACPPFSSPFCDGEIRIESVKLLYEKGKKKVTNVVPKQKVSLSHWTSFVDLAESETWYGKEDKIKILFEASYSDLRERRQKNSVESLGTECVHVEEYCVPKAWQYRDALGLIAESSLEDFALLGAAFLDDQLCMNEGMEIKKLMTVSVEGSPSSLLDPASFSLSLSPCWSSQYLRHSENGGMTLADFSPESEALLLEAGISPDDVVGTALSSPEFPPLEEMDQELYGGSNESLAEKVPSLLNESLESLSDSDSSICEVDGLSIESAASNEAEAGSQASSPLKTGGVDSIYESFQSTEAVLEENSECYGGEAMADTSPCSVGDGDSQIMTSISSRSSSIENHSGLLINSELSSPAAVLNSPMFSSGSIGEGRTIKPPNVLIYTGEDSASEPCVRFKNIRDNLLLCLNPDCYTIYLLTPDQVDKVPWSENTALLVISCDIVEEDVAMHFYTFLSSGGKMVSFCSNLDFPSFSITKLKSVDKQLLISVKYKEWEDVQLLQGLSRYIKTTETCDMTILGYNSVDRTPVILDARSREGEGEGHVIVCQVHLEMDPVVMCSEEAQFARLKQFNHGRLSILRDLLASRLEINCEPRPKPTLTECYLAARNKDVMSQFWTSIKPKLHNNKLKNKKMTLHFICSDYEYDIPTVSSNMLPIVYSSSGCPSNMSFNANTYFASLKTAELGRIMFFAEVLPSTMTVLDGFTQRFTGAVVIARRQTDGKGRGSNQWLSPEGCAMFTANFAFPLRSLLGQQLPFVQHLTSLAMVLAVRKASGCENINLTVKWPNDIYYGREIKVGGSIVNSSILENTVHCSVGCGLNVSNSSPTTCINDLIFLYNQQYASSIPTFSIEEVIARILTELDLLITQFQIYGSADILTEYYSYWLHSNQQVTLEGSGEVVTVQGLDNQGYLKVKTNSGVTLSLQPDGNSFDMMRNLIALKNQ